MVDSNSTALPLLLGIEGGGTKTIALLARGTAYEIGRVELGPANQKLMTQAELVQHFRAIAKSFSHVNGIGVCLAGSWEEQDWLCLRAAAAAVWPGIPCYAGNDLHSAIMAAEESGGRGGPAARVLVLSGTGSCCYGVGARGRTAKVGGWGHLLGDGGSGYDIGLSALRMVAATADRPGSSSQSAASSTLLNWPALGARLLRFLQLNSPNELIDWAQSADKTAIAGLAPEVFAAAADRNRLARHVLADAAERLASDAALCAGKIAAGSAAIEFILAGSILLKQPAFAGAVARKLHRLRPGARVMPLRRESVWGAVNLAAAVCDRGNGTGRQGFRKGGVLEFLRRKRFENPRDSRLNTSGPTVEQTPGLPVTTKMSPTERRNPDSMDLDRMAPEEAIVLMLREESRVPRKLLAHRVVIQRMVQTMTRKLQRGGRVLFVGAGTSGRLGVLESSECPPTFGIGPERIQGILAGGHTALWCSVEGAEDDYSGGQTAIASRRVNEKDAVIGIAASGTTPFVWGAINEARKRGAATALICFNPYLQIPPGLRPDIMLACDLGPEVLTGSTRLKAGTATKLLLNTLSTLAMVRSGKVISNLMVDLNAANAKLRGRARRIVMELTGVNEAQATRALAACNWSTRCALARLGLVRRKTGGKPNRSHCRRR